MQIQIKNSRSKIQYKLAKEVITRRRTGRQKRKQGERLTKYLGENDMDIQTEVMLRVIRLYKKEIHTHRCANAALFSKHYSHSTSGNSTFYNKIFI